MAMFKHRDLNPRPHSLGWDVEDDPAYSQRRRCCVPRCDGVMRDDSPLPTCDACGWKIAQEFRLEIQAEAAKAQSEHLRKVVAKRREILADGSPDGWVYYVQIEDYIKIGFTIQLRQRMRGLRVSPDRLLAAEPGPPSLERERHAEFAAERIHRRENFRPTERLMVHIEAVRAEHGVPSWALIPDTRRIEIRKT